MSATNMANHLSLRHRLRRGLQTLLSHTPLFRGKGRITLRLDALLTDPSDPASYCTTGVLMRRFPFHFDLRPWGQKFAYYYGEWEGELIEAFRALYSGGTFVDVGSSLGLYVVGMSDVVRAAGARIISVEPVPGNMRRQKDNVALNGIEDLVEYVPVCVGAERGVVHVLSDEIGGDNNAFIVNTPGGMACEVVPLDDLIEERHWPRIGAIKIDVEGYDTLVIEGARRCIERDRPVILTELNRERMAINGLTVEPTWRMFRDLRYHAFRVAGRSLTPLTEPGTWENVFFVPEEITPSGLRPERNAR